MDFLKLANIKIPLIYERGAHRIFEQIENQPVTRPILDTDTGYLISPMEGKYRMTCGVYLADHNRPYNWKQLNYSEQVARTRFPLGDIDKTSKDWNGCRTALPDYLPIIGQTKRPGLWVNAGHHHIGLTMAPASAKLLSDMISKNELQLNSPYSPLRF